MKDLPGRHTFETKKEVEKSPDISYTFLFSAHGIQEDFRQLERLFSECDVYVPELNNGSRSFREALLGLASGEITLDDFISNYTYLKEDNPNHGALLQRYKLMAGSKKPIFFAEKIGTKEDVETSKIKMEYLRKAYSAFSMGEIDEAIDFLEGFVRELAQNTIERESYIKHMLGKPLEDFIRAHPDLDGNVEVLVQYGTGHTSLYKEQAGKKKAVLNWMPTIFSPSNVLVRTLVRNPNYEFTDEELLEAIVYMHFQQEFYQFYALHGDDIDNDLLGMTISTMYRDISREKLKDYVKSVQSGNHTSMKEFFGITFPKNEEECMKVLKKYGIKKNE